MSSHCEGKPPAKVLITFSDGAKEEVNTDSVPVEVTVTKKKPVETEEDGDDTAQGNCCNQTYLVKLSYKSCGLSHINPGECAGEPETSEAEPHFTGKLIGIKLRYTDEIATGILATVKDCEGKVSDIGLLGLAGSKLLSYSVISIKRADGKPDICDPPDPDEGMCVITIKNSNGGEIYRKESKCPIKHKVRCGDQCADGEIRCKKNSYPGYCCIDCDELARSLR